MTSNGYYICECGEKYLSNIAFEECRCLNCGTTIKRQEIINGKYETVLKRLKAEGKL